MRVSWHSMLQLHIFMQFWELFKGDIDLWPFQEVHAPWEMEWGKSAFENHVANSVYV